MKKVILITGGGSGLGKAIATLLSPKHQVVILSRNEKELQKVSKEIGCDYVFCDVTDFSACEKSMKDIKEKHGRIDVLINNAGVFVKGNLDDNDSSDIKNVIEVNILGVINMTKAVLPFMKETNKGLIINTNSQAGLYGRSERSVYGASKWAVTGFVKSIEQDLAQENIRITNIYPGKMDTEIFAKYGKEDMSNALAPEVVARSYEFVIDQPDNVSVPELGIKHILN